MKYTTEILKHGQTTFTASNACAGREYPAGFGALLRFIMKSDQRGSLAAVRLLSLELTKPQKLQFTFGRNGLHGPVVCAWEQAVQYDLMQRV